MINFEQIRRQARVLGYVAYAKGIVLTNPHVNLDAALAWSAGYYEGAEAARYEQGLGANDNWSIPPDKMDQVLEQMN
jgi:hypothetical protein